MTTLGPQSLPRGWGRPPVYARFEVKLGKMLDEKRFTGEHSAPYLRNIDVQWDRINTESLPVMDFSEDERERYSLREGDLLVCEGGEVGRTAIWKNQLPECFFQKALHRLRPTTEHDDPRYFFWVMRFAFDFELFSTGEASTIQHLPAESLRKVRYPAPPLSRQRAIAAYLDRETATIDAMIAAKERLLALLAEKRRALITHAVTRGLNPDAPMKDSGVEWLGEIPEHWELTKFSWDVFIAEGQVDPEEPQYRDMTLVAPNHIESGTGRLLASETAAEQAAISGKYLCESGDVIYSKIRPALRKVVLTDTRCLCSADMYPLRPSTRIYAKYLAWFLLGDRFSTWATLESQRVAMPKINREALTAIRIPIPPMDEQEAIAQAVEIACQQCDGLRKVTEGSLRLLSERRSALIAAAVTGQVDVEDAA